MRELKRSERGALVYDYKNEKSEKRAKLGAWLAVALFVALAVLFGLPGDPMHGASKYTEGGYSCAGVMGCAQRGIVTDPMNGADDMAQLDARY